MKLGNVKLVYLVLKKLDKTGSNLRNLVYKSKTRYNSIKSIDNTICNTETIQLWTRANIQAT